MKNCRTTGQVGREARHPSPVLNKEPCISGVIGSPPRSIPGIDEVEAPVLDDGSRDGTAEVALAAEVDYLVRFSQTTGCPSRSK